MVRTFSQSPSAKHPTSYPKINSLLELLQELLDTITNTQRMRSHTLSVTHEPVGSSTATNLEGTNSVLNINGERYTFYVVQSQWNCGLVLPLENSRTRHQAATPDRSASDV